MQKSLEDLEKKYKLIESEIEQNTRQTNHLLFNDSVNTLLKTSKLVKFIDRKLTLSSSGNINNINASKETTNKVI